MYSVDRWGVGWVGGLTFWRGVKPISKIVYTNQKLKKGNPDTFGTRNQDYKKMF
jgi:hypothetical protein